jgi:hypothetical protein
MTIGAGIAAAFARPLIKWGAIAAVAFLAVVAIWGGWQWIQAKEARAEAAEARVEAAEAEVRRAEAELELIRRSSEISEQLVAADLVRLAELAPKVEELRRQLRNAKTPVPAGCDPVLDPVRRAFRGLYELRGPEPERGTSAAGALPGVR